MRKAYSVKRNIWYAKMLVNEPYPPEPEEISDRKRRLNGSTVYAAYTLAALVALSGGLR